VLGITAVEIPGKNISTVEIWMTDIGVSERYCRFSGSPLNVENWAFISKI